MGMVSLWQRLLTPEVGAALRSAVAQSLSTPRPCVPDGSVLLSMVDSRQGALRPLQFERVRRIGCFMARVVSLCWNHTDGYGTCVTAQPMRRADSVESYHFACWAKWAMLLVALTPARQALFLDADVLVLRNPFAEPVVSSGSCARELLLHQYEGPGTNPLNGGQLLTCSARAVRTVLLAMPKRFDGDTPLDQVVAHAALQGPGHYTRRLPAAFAGNCWFGPAHSPPWCGLVSFHAHCTASLAEKLARMRLVLRETAACVARGPEPAFPPYEQPPRDSSAGPRAEIDEDRELVGDESMSVVAPGGVAERDE